MSDFDDPQTAMLLTETEWQDLAVMMKVYVKDTEWVDEDHRTMGDITLAPVRRKRTLAHRIIDAAS